MDPVKAQCLAREAQAAAAKALDAKIAAQHVKPGDVFRARNEHGYPAGWYLVLSVEPPRVVDIRDGWSPMPPSEIIGLERVTEEEIGAYLGREVAEATHAERCALDQMRRAIERRAKVLSFSDLRRRLRGGA